MFSHFLSETGSQWFFSTTSHCVRGTKLHDLWGRLTCSVRHFCRIWVEQLCLGTDRHCKVGPEISLCVCLELWFAVEMACCLLATLLCSVLSLGLLGLCLYCLPFHPVNFRNRKARTLSLALNNSPKIGDLFTLLCCWLFLPSQICSITELQTCSGTSSHWADALTTITK